MEVFFSALSLSRSLSFSLSICHYLSLSLSADQQLAIAHMYHSLASAPTLSPKQTKLIKQRHVRYVDAQLLEVYSSSEHDH